MRDRALPLQAAALSGPDPESERMTQRSPAPAVWGRRGRRELAGRAESAAAASGRATLVYRDRPACSKPTIQGIIRGRVDPRTVINSDGWRGYHGLVDLGYGHVRVDHASDAFTKHR